MNESFGAGFNTTTGISDVKSAQKPEGVVPMLIQQINNSPEHGLDLFGMTFGMVSFVAIARSVDHSSTKITYRLEDHTSQIDGHFWLEEGDMTNTPAIVINTYVRVFGSVRNQGGEKTIMVFKIEPLTTPNEVTTHLLEVLNASLQAEDYSKAPIVSDNDGSNNLMMVDNNDNANFTNNGLDGKNLLIFNAIKDCKNSSGLKIQEIFKKFQHISESEIRQITEFLSHEGHIYTSIDCDHFLTTS